VIRQVVGALALALCLVRQHQSLLGREEPTLSPACQVAVPTVGWLAAVAANAALGVIGGASQTQGVDTAGQIPGIGPIRAARLTRAEPLQFSVRSSESAPSLVDRISPPGGGETETD
jgi:hypothetical protein